MAGESGDEWSPKTREDWTGLFTEAFKGALSQDRSEREEAEAKNAATDAKNENTSGDNQTGEGGNGDASKRTTFADRLLGNFK